MILHKDFREFIELLEKHDVRYLVVGGYALGFHGAPRYTEDLDVFVEPSPENARRLMVALGEFGLGSSVVNPSDFEKQDHLARFGVPPFRIDILTGINGVSFEEAWNGRMEFQHDGLRIKFIGRKEFIKNKRATGRLRDLGDVERLDLGDAASN